MVHPCLSAVFGNTRGAETLPKGKAEISTLRTGKDAGTYRGTWRDIELLPGRLVRFRRPLQMDFGDLRADGRDAWPVVIRAGQRAFFAVENAASVPA